MSAKEKKIRQETPRLQVRRIPPGIGELRPMSYLPSAESSNGGIDGDVVGGDVVGAEEAGVEEADGKAAAGRYQITTVLNWSCAYVVDTTPNVRSPIQNQLSQLADQIGEQHNPLELLENIQTLPDAAYPYLLIAESAPRLYDVWKQGEAAFVIVSEQPKLSSITQAFSTAVDPLQHVYWMYQITDLWSALSPIPKWRSSLLLADNLGIDADQSLKVRQFIAPTLSDQKTASEIPTEQAIAQQTKGELESEDHYTTPQLPELKAFLQSLLAQPHLGTVDTLKQIKKLVLAVSSAETFSQLKQTLADIGEMLLDTPADMPSTASSASVPTASENSVSNNTIEELPLATTMPPKSSATNDSTNDDLLQKDTDSQSQHKVAASKTDSALDNTTEEETDKRLEEYTLLQDSIEFEESEGSESTMVLPMKLVELVDVGQTHVGHQRDHNEDCFFIARQSQKKSDNQGTKTHARGLYVLCDGMGGHAGGEVASQLAAKTLSEYFDRHWPASESKSGLAIAESNPQPLPTEDVVIEAVRLANQAIYDINEQEQRAGHERMGTTLVVVLLQGTSAVVAHVGDSRLYQHSRRLGLKQMTIDHEVGQREIARGVDPDMAYARPDAYQLTQALGPRESAEIMPDVQYLSFSEDTLLLLCSDGLSDNDVVEDYLDSHIDPLLRGKKELETGVDELVQLSNEVNGHDNITAIAILLKVSPDLDHGRLKAV